ncbi:V-type ATP synthase subunit D [candidate division KSB1 bacterium]|nr:V-type ATP synthase subunit D [candidate division KSB1 bacterium]
MRLRVNPNRMEMLRLRRRLAFARRGHKLLKDKQEELMRRFLALVKETRELRGEVEEKLSEGYRAFLSARFEMDREILEGALSFSQKKAQLKVSVLPVMNLRIPEFKLEWQDGQFSYGFADTSGNLDLALGIFYGVLPLMIKMAEREKSLQLLAAELETTRRRVNALEYILIPSLEETIRFIGDKLSELERSNLTRLMKVKEIVRAH